MPSEVRKRLEAFVVFDSPILTRLAKEDADLLASQGLPQDAAPFLNFRAWTPEQINDYCHHGAVPPSCLPIGHNGSGDIIAVEGSTRAVVYFNHDARNQRIFINSSVRQFAECLCLYREHMTARNMAQCLAAVEQVDAAAALSGTMWHAQIGSALAEG